jgi:hypothetical protein
MPRFVRLFNHMIHVPSLSSVSIGTSCWGTPYLSLHFHTQKSLNIHYKKWADCEQAMSKVKTAMVEVEAALVAIPLVEPVAPVVQVLQVVSEVALAALPVVEERVASSPVGGE